MARPQRNNVDYFPHEVDHGKKMYVIRKKFQNEGYAVWFQILEQLGKANFHYLDLSEEDEVIYLAAELLVEEDRLIEIVSELARIKAIDKALWNEHRVIFSEKFAENIQDAYDKRSNKCMTLEGLRKVYPVKVPVNPVKVPVNPQRIVKKSKEEYIKELTEFRSNPDPKWILSLKTEYPQVNIPASLKKICDYWATDEGYKKKMKTKAKTIDWKSTCKNGLNMEWNQVPKVSSDADY